MTDRIHLEVCDARHVEVSRDGHRTAWDREDLELLFDAVHGSEWSCESDGVVLTAWDVAWLLDQIEDPDACTDCQARLGQQRRRCPGHLGDNGTDTLLERGTA